MKDVKKIVKNVRGMIAPLWSLENYVAVNPYQGLVDKRFEEAALYLHQLSSIKSTLPLNFYVEAINRNEITYDDLKAASNRIGLFPKVGIDAWVKELGYLNDSKLDSLETLNQVITRVNQNDWSQLMVDRISLWASVYFDKDQVLWRTTQKSDGDLFLAWKKEAELDRTPEILGLKSFREVVSNLPDSAEETILQVLKKLSISDSFVENYLYALAMNINGWSSYISGLDWDGNLYNSESNRMFGFIAILIAWEYALFETVKDDKVIRAWEESKEKFKKIAEINDDWTSLHDKLILQQAYDIATQRKLITRINSAAKPISKKTKYQSIFCIDVRSEVYRRHLEASSDEMQTMGFAGFFAFPVKYRPLAHQEVHNQCPVLIPSGAEVSESTGDKVVDKSERDRRTLLHQTETIWKSFKLGAISCFSFVGPIGLAYLPKLFTDAFGLTRPVPNPADKGLTSLSKNRTVDYSSSISFDEQVEMAKQALIAMSLTEDFARVIMITGHGSTTVNNPHATGLDCGACGGHTGEANSKVVVSILNKKAIRIALRNEGVEIPEETLFLAAQHDTTTDDVVIFNESNIPSSHTKDVEELKGILNNASKSARTERVKRFTDVRSSNADKEVIKRSRDWAQVRPEWGLAGCNAFVVAPRERTVDVNLEGKSFLHSYNWKKDEGFKVLELILTAPMVVTSWINLQYYASVVDSEKWGAGNKVLHNVTGGMGVLEGYAGDLKVGLPIQSVHDGESFQHLPQRLNVFIEAPESAINDILVKHESVKSLCDNRWIQIFLINGKGKVDKRYSCDLVWEIVEQEAFVE